MWKKRRKFFSLFKKYLIKKLKKESLSGLMGCFVELFLLLGASILGLYVFFTYVFNMYVLYYWRIENVFNVNHDFTNLLIYYCFILLILIVIIIYLIDRRNLLQKIKVFILFYVIVLITGKNFENSLEYILIILAISFGVYCVCCFIGKKIGEAINKNKNIFVKKIYDIRRSLSVLLSIPISMFISVVLIALITAYFQQEYKIIREDERISKVVLYSTKDYYIIADCNEKDNVLKVNNNIQQKISTENVEIEIKKFDKVEKVK